MVSKSTIVSLTGLTIVLIILAYNYVQFSTTIPYEQAETQTIKVYCMGKYFQQPINLTIDRPDFKMSNVTLNGVTSANYTISELRLLVSDCFNGSIVTFQISCKNFNFSTDFFDYSNDGNTFVSNPYRINEYKKEHDYDILVESPLIKDGKFLTWIAIWNSMISFNQVNIDCKPFLTRVAYDKWEGNFLYDQGSGTTEENGNPFSTANLEKITFEMNVPSQYKIETEGLSQYETKDGFKITKSLNQNELFRLTITDKNRTDVKTGAELLISSVGISTVLLAIFGILWGKIKDWYNHRA